jgi:hypothetical protein
VAIKPRYNEAQQEKLNERLDKQLARVYLIWLAGIVVGAIQLRPERVTFSGISYVIDNPEKLQGVIFVGCVAYYLALIGTAIIHQLQYASSSNRAIKRQMIYAAVQTGKKTLMGLGRVGVQVVVFNARLRYLFSAAIMVAILFFPLIHIVIFQQKALLVGVDAIFHTVSFKPDGNIDINSIAPLTIVFAFMLVWTAILQGTLKKFFEKGFYGGLYKHFFALVTFAFVESRIRGDEFFATFMRDAPLQVVIALIWMIPQVIAFPFWVWLQGYLLTIRLVKWSQQKQTGAAKSSSDETNSKS